MIDIMNGYELIKPFQILNAGFSRWTTARKNGKEYFLKEFLDPVYPIDHSITDAVKERVISNCVQTEMKKTKLYEAINRASDGNLVRILEFFRCDTHYYIAMDNVIHTDFPFEKLMEFPFEKRLLLCKSIAHAIAGLHDAHVVHADLKADNILLKTNGEGIVGKIIDFDNAFFEDDPPVEENDINVDQIYLAPETCKLMFGEDIRIDRKIDVFALGILFHQYLTGADPEFDHVEYDYAHEALLNGSTLTVSDDLPDIVQNLLRDMLEEDPEKRPDMQTVFQTLWELDQPVIPSIEEQSEEKAENDTDSFFSMGGDLM